MNPLWIQNNFHRYFNGKTIQLAEMILYMGVFIVKIEFFSMGTKSSSAAVLFARFTPNQGGGSFSMLISTGVKGPPCKLFTKNSVPP